MNARIVFLLVALGGAVLTACGFLLAHVFRDQAQNKWDHGLSLRVLGYYAGCVLVLFGLVGLILFGALALFVR